MNGGEKTNKTKLPSLLALILILFLSLSVVSASDNIHVTNTSDSVIDNSMSISDSSYDDLISNSDDSKYDDSLNQSDLENLDLNQDSVSNNDDEDISNLDDEITENGLKEPSRHSSLLTSGSDENGLCDTELIIINSSHHSRYFDSNDMKS